MEQFPSLDNFTTFSSPRVGEHDENNFTGIVFSISSPCLHLGGCGCLCLRRMDSVPIREYHEEKDSDDDSDYDSDDDSDDDLYDIGPHRLETQYVEGKPDQRVSNILVRGNDTWIRLALIHLSTEYIEDVITESFNAILEKHRLRVSILAV